MRTYFSLIAFFQKFLLALGISTLLVLPPLVAFWPNGIPSSVSSQLYAITHILLLFVMSIRPLADIMTWTRFIRPLVQLRKGAGVVSAAIVVSFMLAKAITDPVYFFQSFFTAEYWSMNQLALLAHLADITGVLLLVTSNNFSKRILGTWWKRVQKLSYVFFYASGIYVYISYKDTVVLNYLFIVTLLTLTAFILNHLRRQKEVR